MRYLHRVSGSTGVSALRPASRPVTAPLPNLPVGSSARTWLRLLQLVTGLLLNQTLPLCDLHMLVPELPLSAVQDQSAPLCKSP